MESKEISLWKLPKEMLVGFFVVLAFMAYVIYDQSHWWEAKPDYSFGYVVPMFVGFILYDRWSKISSHLVPDDQQRQGGFVEKISWVFTAFFICVFVSGVLFFGLGGIIRANAGVSNVSSLVIAMGFSALFLSIVFFVCDKDIEGTKLSMSRRLALLGLFVFPALIWLLSAPLLSSVETRLNLFLMNKVSWVVFEVFNLLGIAIRQEGNTLRFPNGDTVMVAEACSGIRSLTGCLFSGSFLAAVFLEQWWKKILLVLMAMALAVFTNLIRSMTLTSVAYNYGSESIDAELWGSNIHDITGYAVLGLTTILLLCILPFFNLKSWLASIYIPKEERELES